MTNNNDWKEGFDSRFGDEIIERFHEYYYTEGHNDPLDEAKNFVGDMRMYISQNFIPLSSLKKFIEENKQEVCGCDEDPHPQAPGYHTKECDMRPYGFNSALKLLKDKFIHNK